MVSTTAVRNGFRNNPRKLLHMSKERQLSRAMKDLRASTVLQGQFTTKAPPSLTWRRLDLMTQIAWRALCLSNLLKFPQRVSKAQHIDTWQYACQSILTPVRLREQVNGQGGVAERCWKNTNGIPGVSMTLQKWLVITQNKGVMDPFVFRVMETPGMHGESSPLGDVWPWRACRTWQGRT